MISCPLHRTTDPRRDKDLNIRLRQQIISTTDARRGRMQDLCYKEPETEHLYDVKKDLEVILDREQCLEIDRSRQWDKLGFWKSDTTSQWWFFTEIRIVVDWPDMVSTPSD